jgi:hypothetical protein
MVLFKRNRGEGARTSNVGLGWNGEGEPKPVKALIQALVVEYERILTNPDIKITRSEDSLWAAVPRAARWHNQAMKLALRTAPRAERRLAEPMFQAAIVRALDQFAGVFGLPGGLISAWGTAELFNRRTQARWMRSEQRFWWDESPLYYSCLVESRKTTDRVAGLLLVDGGNFSFTPSLDQHPDFAFVSDQVESAEFNGEIGAMLYFKSDVPWLRAEFAADVPPVTAALHRAGLQKHDLNGVLGELLDDAVRDGAMDVLTADEMRRRGVPPEPGADGPDIATGR